LSRYLRFSDEIFRYSDDEFVITLANTDLAEAQDLMSRLDSETRSLAVHHENTIVQAPIAAGVAALTPADDPKLLLKRTDQALRAARQAFYRKASVR
jgi:diguanylate cyclase (GGDEF)-like protein